MRFSAPHPVAFLSVLVGALIVEPASAADGLFLALRAGGRTRSVGQRELWGLLELSVPLDLWMLPALTTASSGAPQGATISRGDASSWDAGDDDSGFAESPPDDAADGSERSAEADAAGAFDDGGDRPETALGWRPERALSSDLCRRVVARALELAGRGRVERRLDDLGWRARASAALPEVRLRAGRSADQSVRLTPTLDDPYRYSQAGGADLWFEGRLSWRLDRLVFARDELGVERLRLQHQAVLERLMKRVLDTFFDWQRAVVLAADVTALPEERTRAALDALRAATLLEVFTGGAFHALVDGGT